MQKIGRISLRILSVTLVTLILVEILLQVFYLNLPQAIIQRMPQYPERYGIQFDTPHGAREYPANEVVNFEVNQYTGDLYQISCLSPLDAVEIEPYTVSYTRDSHGFRTPFISSNNADLVIIGDSFTAAESIQTPYWEGLSESTIVLGLPGSGTLEQKILLEEFGLEHNPDVIVLAYFGGNDLTDNQTFYDLRQQNLSFADKTHQNRTPLDYLVTVHLALFIRDALTPTTDTDCHYPVTVQTDPPTPLAFFDTMVSLLTQGHDTLENSEAYQVTRDSILEIAQLAEDQETELVLMYIPQKAEVYWELLEEEDQQNIVSHLPRYAGVDNPQLTVEAIEDNLTVQHDLLSELADKHSFHFVDLTPALMESAVNGEPPYFFADTHWNQLGHDIARQILGDKLRQLPLDKNSNS